MSAKVKDLPALPPGLHLWFDQVEVQSKSAAELAILFCKEPKAWRYIDPHTADVPIFVNICGVTNRWGTQPLAWVLDLLRLLEALRDRQAAGRGVH